MNRDRFIVRLHEWTDSTKKIGGSSGAQVTDVARSVPSSAMRLLDESGKAGGILVPQRINFVSKSAQKCRSLMMNRR